MVVYPFSRILLSNKKDWTIDRYIQHYDSQNNGAEWKKTDTNIHTIRCLYKIS